jgi:hypothetical protein
MVQDPNAMSSSMANEHMQSLLEAMNQTPMPAQSQSVAALVAVESGASSDFQEQFDEAKAAREAKTHIRLRTERLVREATKIKQDALHGIGEPPRPVRMVQREILINPDVAAMAWTPFAIDLIRLHMERVHPDWLPYVQDDHAVSCDMLVKLNTRNTHTRAGWDFSPEQLLFLCNTNGADLYPWCLPNMETIDWNGASDPTWIIKSASGGAKARQILTQAKVRIPNASLTSIRGRNAVTITEAVSTMVDGMQKCQCAHASRTKQGVDVPQGDSEPRTAEVCDSIAEDELGNFYTCSVNHVLNVCWMLNDAFAGNKQQDVAAGDHEAVGELAMKIFSEAVKMGLMAHQFPRDIFTVGASADTWSGDKRFDFYASVARICIAMTGHNVSSGVHDRDAIALHRHSVKKTDSTDRWHYVKAGSFYVEHMMAAWAARDSKYASMITSGCRNMPKNWAHMGTGVALRAAGTLGRRLGSADANGVGGAATDISPPRWSEQHDHRHAPEQCCAGYIWGFDGKPADTSADIPWHLVSNMACQGDDVGLEYLEPLYYSAQPNWMTELGIKDMLDKSAMVGAIVYITGLDRNPQSVPTEQQAAYLAAQWWDHHWSNYDYHESYPRDS